MQQTQHTDTVRRSHLSKRELYGHYLDVTTAVIDEWVRLKGMSPVVAHQIDPEPITRSEKLTFDLLCYRMDIEIATEQALGADRLDYQAAWFGLAAKEPVNAALLNEVVWRCGRIYSARGLSPWEYWRRGNSYRRSR